MAVKSRSSTRVTMKRPASHAIADFQASSQGGGKPSATTRCYFDGLSIVVCVPQRRLESLLHSLVS
jgi:hypothetical protein